MITCKMGFLPFRLSDKMRFKMKERMVRIRERVDQPEFDVRKNRKFLKKEIAS